MYRHDEQLNDHFVNPNGATENGFCFDYRGVCVFASPDYVRGIVRERTKPILSSTKPRNDNEAPLWVFGEPIVTET